jgi:phenylalanyl-tRNA synthetase beta subunit
LKNTDQRERFEQAARELGVDLDEEKLKETLKRMGYHDTVMRDEKPADK